MNVCWQVEQGGGGWSDSAADGGGGAVRINIVKCTSFTFK